MILDLTDKEYFKSVGLNASALKEFDKSPAHYDAYVNRTIRKPSDAFRIGSQAHASILENKELNIMPECDRRTKAGKEAFKEFQESLEDKQDYVTAAELESIKTMKSNVLAHPAAAVINNPEWAERCIFVTCPQTGLELKAKYDCLPDQGNIIYDLKTCQDASPDSFKWDIKKFRYYIQAAHYLYVAELEGLNKDHFVFICVEKQEPFGVSAITLDPETLHFARKKYFYLLNKFTECRENNNFKECYSSEIEAINLNIK
jgi:exodeoxyribonuclease VIII